MREGATGDTTGRPTLVLVTGLQGTGKSTLAEAIAPTLGAPVLGWDWAMAALTPFPEVQKGLDELDQETFRRVGWSLLWQVARAQLRRGMSAVLDGMARDGEVAGTRLLAAELGARSFVVMAVCDEAVQRSRIDGRRRNIPGWYELDWDQVSRSRAAWKPPSDVDLIVDTQSALPDTLVRLRAALAGAGGAT